MDNRSKLLWASFLTLIAAGMGFAVRGGVLTDWELQFGFTKSELGNIIGGGLTGFGLIIIASSLFVDKIGYKPILMIAFVLHIASAGLTLAATPVFEASGKDATYSCLFWGMFMFAIANGLCEAVINPLVATLYPKKKTHYLNILHAGWPGGLILGALMAYLFVGKGAVVTQLNWEVSMCFFLIPVALYGLVVLKEKFPVSDVKAAGISFVQMLREFAAPMLLFLFVLHAMVGYVELGTDSWITNIMNNVISGKALLLFIYTSAIMFVLRFFAGPIVERINPVGLLCVSSVLGAVGLYALGSAETGVVIVIAATTYGVGKTFLWPTMLGVVGERFPKGGAVTMGMIGGVGMLSAGLLGGPGIGYKQDKFAAQHLQQEAPEVYTEFKASKDNRFLFFPPVTGLDGAKAGKLSGIKKEDRTDDEQAVMDAQIYGGRMALKWTAAVPALMAIGYLMLVLYFRSKGGYQQEVLHGEQPDGEKYTGGVEGPVE